MKDRPDQTNTFERHALGDDHPSPFFLKSDIHKIAFDRAVEDLAHAELTVMIDMEDIVLAAEFRARALDDLEVRLDSCAPEHSAPERAWSQILDARRTLSIVTAIHDDDDDDQLLGSSPPT